MEVTVRENPLPSELSGSVRQCLLPSGYSNCTATGILLSVLPPLHTSFSTPEVFPKKKKKLALRWHGKQCQNFSQGQTFSKGLPGITHPTVFSLRAHEVKTVGAWSWCWKPAWKAANVFFVPNSQHSVSHRVEAFPSMCVQNTSSFSLFPVGPMLITLHSIQQTFTEPLLLVGNAPASFLLCSFLPPH